MPQGPPSEFLNSELLATIERQRRIICDLLIKNQALRTRLMKTASKANEPPERENMRARFEPGRQTARFGEMRIAVTTTSEAARRPQ